LVQYFQSIVRALDLIAVFFEQFLDEIL